MENILLDSMLKMIANNWQQILFYMQQFTLSQ